MIGEITHIVPNKIAFCMVPIIAGPYSFYQNLKKSLAPYHYKVLCVGCLDGTVKPDHRILSDNDLILLNVEKLHLKEKIQKFVGWVEDNNIKTIIINNANNFELSAMPYLPVTVARVTMDHLLWSRGYRAVITNLAYNDKIIVLNQRQRHTLIKQYSVPPQMIQVIAHGIEIPPKKNTSTETIKSKKNLQSPVRLLYLGRLEELQKAVLQLPKIARHLKSWNIPFTLTIIGDGEARQGLEHNFKKCEVHNQVFLKGLMAPPKVKELLAGDNFDILLFPSRSETFGLALIEAMGEGIVPIASLIENVTDTIIINGRNGILCKIGDSKAFAGAVARIAQDPALFYQMSQNARHYIRERFSLESMGKSYDKLFREIMTLPPRKMKDLEKDPPKTPLASKPTLMTRLPDPLKMWIRQKIYDVTGREL